MSGLKLFGVFQTYLGEKCVLNSLLCHTRPFRVRSFLVLPASSLCSPFSSRFHVVLSLSGIAAFSTKVPCFLCPLPAVLALPFHAQVGLQPSGAAPDGSLCPHSSKGVLGFGLGGFLVLCACVCHCTTQHTTHLSLGVSHYHVVSSSKTKTESSICLCPVRRIMYITRISCGPHMHQA